MTIQKQLEKRKLIVNDEKYKIEQSIFFTLSVLLNESFIHNKTRKATRLL